MLGLAGETKENKKKSLQINTVLILKNINKKGLFTKAKWITILTSGATEIETM